MVDDALSISDLQVGFAAQIRGQKRGQGQTNSAEIDLFSFAILMFNVSWSAVTPGECQQHVWIFLDHFSNLLFLTIMVDDALSISDLQIGFAAQIRGQKRGQGQTNSAEIDLFSFAILMFNVSWSAVTPGECQQHVWIFLDHFSDSLFLTTMSSHRSCCSNSHCSGSGE